jgi:hypothetical protein
MVVRCGVTLTSRSRALRLWQSALFPVGRPARLVSLSWLVVGFVPTGRPDASDRGIFPAPFCPGRYKEAPTALLFISFIGRGYRQGEAVLFMIVSSEYFGILTPP